MKTAAGFLGILAVISIAAAHGDLRQRLRQPLYIPAILVVPPFAVLLMLRGIGGQVAMQDAFASYETALGLDR